MQTQSASAKTGSSGEGRILEHLPQIRAIARQIRRSLPGRVSLAYLVSAGIAGLAAAIESLDPRCTSKRKTRAQRKARNPASGGLSATHWSPRKVRRKTKRLADSISRMEQGPQKRLEERLEAHSEEQPRPTPAEDQIPKELERNERNIAIRPVSSEEEPSSYPSCRAGEIAGDPGTPNLCPTNRPEPIPPQASDSPENPPLPSFPRISRLPSAAPTLPAPPALPEPLQSNEGDPVQSIEAAPRKGLSHERRTDQWRR